VRLQGRNRDGPSMAGREPEDSEGGLIFP